MSTLNHFDYVAATAAAISLITLVANLFIHYNKKKKDEIITEHQLINFFLGIDNLLIKYPHLSDTLINRNDKSDIFLMYDRDLVAFAYKQLNIFEIVYNTYFSINDIPFSRKKIERRAYRKQWYDFVRRRLSEDTLLKEICIEILKKNTTAHDYSRNFADFMIKTFQG